MPASVDVPTSSLSSTKYELSFGVCTMPIETWRWLPPVAVRRSVGVLVVTGRGVDGAGGGVRGAHAETDAPAGGGGERECEPAKHRCDYRALGVERSTSRCLARGSGAMASCGRERARA